MHFRTPIPLLLTTLLATSPLTTATTTPSYNTTYPNKPYITSVFSALQVGNSTAFLNHVAPNVTWTIMGTHPLAGTYHNSTIFATDALARLENTASSADPLVVSLVNVIGGGDEEWSVEELTVNGVLKNGMWSCVVLRYLMFFSLFSSPLLVKRYAYWEISLHVNRACVQQHICMGDALGHQWDYRPSESVFGFCACDEGDCGE